MEYMFRKANEAEATQIWGILQQAIKRREQEGSEQWQDGYPNLAVVQHDIEKGVGYVLTDQNIVIGYCAIFIKDEPEYANIDGKWLTHEDFVAYHRVVISTDYLGKGLAQIMLRYIEDFASERNIYSIKADTNFDNAGMLRIFEKLGYTYCGEVTFRGGKRRAFEKVLSKSETK